MREVDENGYPLEEETKEQNGEYKVYSNTEENSNYIKKVQETLDKLLIMEEKYKEKYKNILDEDDLQIISDAIHILEGLIDE